MKDVKPLPDFLVNGYRNWKSESYAKKQGFFLELAGGQSPKTMVITCSDSRLLPSELFNAGEGELFMQRNVANLIPPYVEDGSTQATPASIQYAVTALKIPHIVVMGHSGCGGVLGCDAMCSGAAENLRGNDSFVGRWLEILRPGYERVKHIEDQSARIAALEKQAVIVSLENLMGFPFVQEAMNNGTLSVHGLWHNIGEGVIEYYDDATGEFQPV